MNPQVTFETHGGTLCCRLSCEIDHHTAKSIREAIDAEIFLRKPCVLELDFSGVPLMDSSGIGLILGRAEVAGAVGASVRLCGSQGEIARLIRLSGVERLPGITLLG